MFSDNDPIVSVIVPVYNVSTYLHKCINSILNQTLTGIEIVLVCDGVDEDENICKSYLDNDTRIKLILGVHKGVGGARNAGMREAKGRYFCFVDGDDYIDNNYCKDMLNAIEFFGADMVHCHAGVVYSKKYSDSIVEGDSAYLKLKYSGLCKFKNSMIGNVDVAVWNKLFRRSLIEKYNITYPENICNEDAFFVWAYMSICKNIFYENTTLYYYVRREGSLMDRQFSNSLSNTAISHVIIGELFYKFLENNMLIKFRVDAFLNAYFVSVIYSLVHTPDCNRNVIESHVICFLKQIEQTCKYKDKYIEICNLVKADSSKCASLNRFDLAITVLNLGQRILLRLKTSFKRYF